MCAFINVLTGTPIDRRGGNTLMREGRGARLKLSRHILFLTVYISFYRTTVISGAQCCAIEISHRLYSEHQTVDADGAICAMLWVHAAGCVVKSDAAIFRLSAAIDMAQYCR